MRALLPLLAFSLVVGCGDDPFTPRYLLDEYRVLAMTADPPAVRTSGTVTLSVTDFAPADLGPEPDPARVYVWSVCLYSLGSLANFECVPGLERVTTTADPELSIDFGPGGDFGRIPVPAELLGDELPLPDDVETLADLVTAAASVPLPAEWTVPVDRLDGVAREDATFGTLAPDDSFTSLVTLVVTVVENSVDVPEELSTEVDPDDTNAFIRLEASIPGSKSFIAAKRIRVVADDEEAELNRPPKVVSLTGVEQGQRLPLGASVDLVAEVEDPDSDEAADLLLSWYVSDGDLDLALASGNLLENRWRLPDVPGSAQLYLVLRDRLGGLDVVERRVQIVAEM